MPKAKEETKLETSPLACLAHKQLMENITKQDLLAVVAELDKKYASKE